MIYFKVLKGKKLVLILVDQNILNENNSGLGALTSHCWGMSLPARPERAAESSLTIGRIPSNKQENIQPTDNTIKSTEHTEKTGIIRFVVHQFLILTVIMLTIVTRIARPNNGLMLHQGKGKRKRVVFGTHAHHSRITRTLSGSCHSV